jgi:hypothetical protein
MSERRRPGVTAHAFGDVVAGVHAATGGSGVVPQGLDKGEEATQCAECGANCAHHRRPAGLSWAWPLKRILAATKLVYKFVFAEASLLRPIRPDDSVKPLA